MRIAKLLSRFALAAIVTAGQAAHGVDDMVGRNIAANCAACHGTVGMSEGAIPQLAGLRKDYIIEQMNAFKSGKRPATVMHQIAKGYSDDQVTAVAEYIAQQHKQ